jgi:hypothetical protein
MFWFFFLCKEEGDNRPLIGFNKTKNKKQKNCGPAAQKNMHT